MGYPMARNLLRAGHEVALWSNTAEKAQRTGRRRRRASSATPRSRSAQHADCIFLCVGDTDDVGEGDPGRRTAFVEGAKPGTVVADASTIGPSESRQIGSSSAKPRASIFWTLPAPDPPRAPKAAP